MTPMEYGFIPKPHIVNRMFSHRVLIVTIVAIIIAIVAYLWFLNQAPRLLTEQNFQVEQGESIHNIAKNLLEQGFIKHRAFFYFNYYVFGQHAPIEAGGYKLLGTMTSKEMIRILESTPIVKKVKIPKDASKEDIGNAIADALNWDQHDRQFFSHTYAGMQWQEYQDYIEPFFREKYSWNEDKTHTFLTLSALYYDQTYDFLKNMYLPGTYEIPVGATRAQAAGILIERFKQENPDKLTALEKYADQETATNVAKLIEDQMVLMPDIVSIPPLDIVLKKENGRTYLLFTGSYWNKGRGPLELVADPATKNLTDDHNRKIFQRVYSLDGNYTERLSGIFLWHSPHKHYHFQDFAVYGLEGIGFDAPDQPSKLSQKSTYCVRDSEPIDLAHPGASKSPSYSICGKERQGISPGWADSYYYTYVDQKFDVTNFPAGQYKLTMTVNPLNRFDEITTDNNVGETIINLDVANNKVRVMSEETHGFSN